MPLVDRRRLWAEQQQWRRKVLQCFPSDNKK
jgi:hypothetical protein